MAWPSARVRHRSANWVSRVRMLSRALADGLERQSWAEQGDGLLGAEQLAQIHPREVGQRAPLADEDGLVPGHRHVDAVVDQAPEAAADPESLLDDQVAQVVGQAGPVGGEGPAGARSVAADHVDPPTPGPCGRTSSSC